MIVEKIIEKLPGEVSFEGIAFTPTIFNDFGEVRLCYQINYVMDNSPHKEEYDNYGCWNNRLLAEGDDEYYTCGFLWLCENIQTDEELCEAIDECYDFLLKHKLV